MINSKLNFSWSSFQKNTGTPKENGEEVKKSTLSADEPLPDFDEDEEEEQAPTEKKKEDFEMIEKSTRYFIYINIFLD